MPQSVGLRAGCPRRVWVSLTSGQGTKQHSPLRHSDRGCCRRPSGARSLAQCCAGRLGVGCVRGFQHVWAPERPAFCFPPCFLTSPVTRCSFLGAQRARIQCWPPKTSCRAVSAPMPSKKPEANASAGPIMVILPPQRALRLSVGFPARQARLAFFSSKKICFD